MANAIYFSRAPIPWVRDTASKIQVRHLKHLGLYVFQRAALLEYPTLPQGEWTRRAARTASLDGKWLEDSRCGSGARRDQRGFPEDVARVEKLLQK